MDPTVSVDIIQSRISIKGKTEVGLVSNTKDIDKYTSSLSPSSSSSSSSSSSAAVGLALAAADLPLATFFLGGDGTSSSSESSSCQMMKRHSKNLQSFDSES